MVNKVILIGNVGADPEVRYLEGGVATVNLSLATSETYKDRNTGERITQTEWHNVVFWRGLAEIVEKYVKKGTRLYIEGRLRSRSWEDQNGVKHYRTEVQADNMQMLSSRQEQGGMPGMENSTHTAPTTHSPAATSAPKPMPSSDITMNDDDTDDLPF
ncbi:MAG: single-stranded DNA-binding protein [Marinifilaceae bacterium]